MLMSVGVRFFCIRSDLENLFDGILTNAQRVDALTRDGYIGTEMSIIHIHAGHVPMQVYQMLAPPQCNYILRCCSNRP